jgi:hypothetical protein
MPGELVPLVLLPRYTTFVGRPASGTQFFSTIAMDVTEYSKAIVNVWRGKVFGTAVPVQFTFQESTDQVEWTACTLESGSQPFDPGENVETQYIATIKKRWFRVTVQFGNADNFANCWAVGFLEQRLS